ncbi:hypothetical protein FD755_004025 [Muntiacus reevesi]|uniref:Immunoglobulin domain-containing protein n=1 Tax=Muntiacus reevesi TaxID=9886 RepID=A0A5J5MP80_MUNRE|nr:hypothetical protein FD755_004025 [Muntiacus reevesi]
MCMGSALRSGPCFLLGNFPIPSISAMPSSVIPWNGSVKILCQGTLESYLYQLEILENLTYRVVEKKLGFQEVAEFVINHMDTNTAGRYQCRYGKEHRWSAPSEALELVVTGLYDKPFLSTDGGQVAMPGENISLRCGSAHVSFDRFSLSRPGGATLSRHRDARLQGDFTLGPVNLSFSGVYMCYGWHSGRPYVWSAPSNALELVVTGTTSQDHTTENWIRLGMAGLVLIVLLAILAENQRGPQVLHQKDQQDLPDLSWSRQESQTEWTFRLTPKDHQGYS